MLTAEMITYLNNQLNLEFFSSNLYLQMSAWCNDKGFEGTSSFLRKNSREEIEHMWRIFNYLSDTGTMPIVGKINAPPFMWHSLFELLEEALQHEKLISMKINELVHLAIITRDYSTFNFLQWYVSEQHEEEKLLKNVLNRLKIVGNAGEGLFLVDKDLGLITIKNRT